MIKYEDGRLSYSGEEWKQIFDCFKDPSAALERHYNAAVKAKRWEAPGPLPTISDMITNWMWLIENVAHMFVVGTFEELAIRYIKGDFKERNLLKAFSAGFE